MKAILLEPNKELAEATLSILEEHGHDTVQVKSTEDVLEAYENNPNSIVIVDIDSKGSLDVYDLLDEITSKGGALVVTSDLSHSIYAVESVKRGARAYVMKNKLDNQLPPAITAVVEGRVFLNEKLTTGILNRAIEPQITKNRTK